jgi:dTDP-4-dehydrorhamnose 3,5-epimerase
MDVSSTAISEVLLIEPRVFDDVRGAFFETWREDRYAPHVGGLPFVQDNVSVSARGVVRGLHLQHPNGQGKLVTVLRGSAFDVAVDVRVGSPTFGRWVGVTLSAVNNHQLWIPPGFAHGFQALEDETIVLYKCTAPYDPQSEIMVQADDPEMDIAWPIDERSSSAKDAEAPRLADLHPGQLPSFE